MTDHVGELYDRHAGFELLYNEGVAEIIDLGPFDASNTEVAIDGGADVTDQERITSLGDKEGSVFGFWATSGIFLDS